MTVRFFRIAVLLVAVLAIVLLEAPVWAQLPNTAQPSPSASPLPLPSQLLPRLRPLVNPSVSPGQAGPSPSPSPAPLVYPSPYFAPFPPGSSPSPVISPSPSPALPSSYPYVAPANPERFPAPTYPVPTVNDQGEVVPSGPPRGVRGPSNTWQLVNSVEVLERFQNLRLERLRSSEKKLADQEASLARYGLSFFSRSSEEMDTQEASAVPLDYQLVPGDTVEAIMTNRNGGSATQSLVLNEQGDVDVTGLGSVPLQGLTSQGAEARLNDLLGRSRLSNFQLRLRITQASRLRVFVVGEAVRPGGYLLASGGTLLDALFRAGGPTEAGSFRKLELQRNGRTVGRLDIYALLRDGRVQSPRLLQGDRILVPLAGDQVSVIGDVRRPAIYELSGERTLREVVALAGGLLPGAYQPRAEIRRFVGGELRVLDVDLLSPRTNIQSGDVLVVRSILSEPTNSAYLEGAVKRPGWYQLKPGTRAADILRQAQGMREGAYPGHAEIYRRAGPDQVEMLGFSIELALQGDPVNNVLLQPDDFLLVYDEREVEYDQGKVRVQGYVTRPGDYPHFSRMRVRDLLALAGGLTPGAALKGEVARVHDDGQVELIPFDVRNALSSGQSSDNLELQDGDALVIRPRLRARRFAASIALLGEFKNPGVYNVNLEEETIQSVIARAGGLTDKAYLPAAVFTRELSELMTREPFKNSELVLNTIQDVANQFALAESQRQQALARSPIPIAHVTSPEQLTIATRDIDHLLHTQRIPIHLETIIQSGEGDPGLKDGDVLLVPTQPRTVTIVGAVPLPSAQAWKPQLTMRDYVEKAGGMTRDAAEDEILILRASGELLREPGEYSIEPGDTIVVPTQAIVAGPDAFESFLSVLQALSSGAFISQSLLR